MTTTGIIIVVVVVLFVVGQLLALKVNPHDQSMGNLRDKARQMGLNPRLVPAPDWVGFVKQDGTKGGMIGYYHILDADLEAVLTRAKIYDGKLEVIDGNFAINNFAWPLPYCLAVEVQANSVSVYWEEKIANGQNADSTLQTLKQLLEGVAQVIKQDRLKKQAENQMLATDTTLG